MESRREVADRVGCHPRTVARAEQRGELHPVRFSARMVRYYRTEVNAWISRGRAHVEGGSTLTDRHAAAGNSTN